MAPQDDSKTLSIRDRTRIGAILQRAEGKWRSSTHANLALAMGNRTPEAVIFADVSDMLAEHCGLLVRDLRARNFETLASSTCLDEELLVAAVACALQVETRVREGNRVFALSPTDIRDRVNAVLASCKYHLRVGENQVDPAAPEEVRALSEKFGILRAPGQLPLDFAAWRDSAAGVAILFFDIDHFKKLNTDFTETVVDRDILGPFQELLDAEVDGRGGAYAVGGDEFNVLLRNVSDDEALAFARRLHRTIAGWGFSIGTSTIRLSVSVGVACYPKDALDLEALKLAANMAESEAKRMGRNQVVAAPKGGPRAE